jgi:hypothetical protein
MNNHPISSRWLFVCLTLFAAGSMLLGGCGYSASATERDPADEATMLGEQPEPSGPPRYQLPNGYTMGTVHPTGVKTVYVETFQSQDLRRGLEFRLSESLVKRILLDTPYRIAPKDKADTVLYGEIRQVRNTLLGKDFASDLPRETQTVMVVAWTWKDRRTGEVRSQRSRQTQASEFLPLAGETFYDGSEEGINDLAERIVEAMMAPW